MKVTIYTINDCKFSQAEKDYLKKNNIAFEEKNLETNRDFLTEMLSISDNFAGTPVTQIEKDDGTKVVLKGFTEKEFAAELGLPSAGEVETDTSVSAPEPAEPTTESVQPVTPAETPEPVIESLSDSPNSIPTTENVQPASDNQSPSSEPTAENSQPAAGTQPTIPEGTTSPGPTQDNQIKPISLSDNSSMPTQVSETGPSPMPPSKINVMNDNISQPAPVPTGPITDAESPAENALDNNKQPTEDGQSATNEPATAPANKDLNSVLQNLESQVGTEEKKEDTAATAPATPTPTDTTTS